MDNELNKTIEDLKFLGKIQSYSILRGLRDIKEFYMPLEESLDKKIKQLEVEKKELPRIEGGGVGVEYFKIRSEGKSLISTIHINRSSTLLMLSAFIENVFMTRIYDEIELHEKHKNWVEKLGEMRGKERQQYDLSTIGKAVYVLKSESEFKEITSLDFQYVYEMNTIRNKFVHQYGMIFEDDKKNEKLMKVLRKYDTELKNDKIILGANFIPKYIEHLEILSFQVAEILYDDESYYKKMLDENPQNKESWDRINQLIEEGRFVEVMKKGLKMKGITHNLIR